MQHNHKLDQNLIFGEFHDKSVIKTFLSTHMSQFYQQGYHIIVLELNEDLPVGDMIDDSLPANSSLRTLMEKAHKLVLENSSTASPLLDKIEKNIGPILVQGSDKPSFALLVKTALANKLQVRFFDYLEDPGGKKLDPERVKKYDDDVAAKLGSLKEKWLELTGDEHVPGIVGRLGHGVSGFQYSDLNSGIIGGTLKSIQDLEQVKSIP
jgi:hypothetical protein